jgi:DNA polymerase III gamma/tau subunit
VTDEARERLREQANQLGAPTVVRLIDLLAVAVEDLRQGGDPRLPLELALVKVTRPGSDLSRESLAYRIERLEAGQQAPPAAHPAPASSPAEPAEEPQERAPGEPPSVELEQLQEAWRRTIIPAVEERSIPVAAMLGEAHPTALAGDTLTLEFPPAASFHRKLAEEPKNAGLLRDALYEVTGRRLGVAFAVGTEPARSDADDDRPHTEEEIVELIKGTFDARELDR